MQTGASLRAHSRQAKYPQHASVGPRAASPQWEPEAGQPYHPQGSGPGNARHRSRPAFTGHNKTPETSRSCHRWSYAGLDFKAAQTGQSRQRVGAFLLRQCHELLAFAPHNAWLYVDDPWTTLHKENAQDLFAIMIIFFAAIHAPMSWKKDEFAKSINWCGWTIGFKLDTIQLIGNKLTKLLKGRSTLCRHRSFCVCLGCVPAADVRLCRVELNLALAIRLRLEGEVGVGHGRLHGLAFSAPRAPPPHGEGRKCANSSPIPLPELPHMAAVSPRRCHMVGDGV